MNLRQCLFDRGMTQRALCRMAAKHGDRINPSDLSLIVVGRRHAFAPERIKIVKALLAYGIPADEVASIDELKDRPDGRRRHKALNESTHG